MAKSYEQIQKQIEALQAEAEKLRRKEIDEVIERIRSAIDHYGITAADLGFGAGAKAAKGGRKKPGRKPGAKAATKAATTPAYADGTGNTWGGRGKRPDWLRNALASGRTLEEFKVKAPDA